MGDLSGSSGSGARGGRGSWVGLFLSAVCPYLAYQGLAGAGVAVVPALAVAAVFPALAAARRWLLTRRPDALGVISLLFIALGIGVAVATDNPRAVLLQGSIANAVYGLVCFGSLLLPRPLLFYVSREFAAAGDATATLRFDALWRQPAFRTSQRVLTVAWGLWGLAQAVARSALITLLPVATFLGAWHSVDTALTAALVWWSIAYSRRAAQPLAISGSAVRLE